MRRYQVSHTDIVRLVVITSLTISSIFITSLSLARHVETIYAQLFYFPILYATYFYPRRGLYLAGFCAVVYQVSLTRMSSRIPGGLSTPPGRQFSLSASLPSWCTLPKK